MLIPSHQAVTCASVHEVARPLKSGPAAVRLILKQIVDPFAVNVGGPLRAIHIHDGELQ